MQLKEGVNLHFIQTDKFTTNQITIRFAAPISEKTVAGRVLVANILERGNQLYPTSQDFRLRLAELYGAHFSTSVLKRGEVHIVDMTISYISSHYLPNQENLTASIIELVRASLFQPLADKAAFQSDIFEIEKKNLLSFLETEIEDNFYHADRELDSLFFEERDQRIPKFSTVDLVKKESSKSTFRVFQQMIRMDRIDIFVVGKVDKKLIVETFKTFPFSYRNPKLHFEYKQEFSPVLQEKLERKQARQSVLEMAYHLQVVYSDVNYPALLVWNGLVGAFSHSYLFTHTREKDGLAYTIGSQLSIFSNLLKIYAGIDKNQKLRVIRSIHRQLLAVKCGKFSEEDLELTKKMLLSSIQLSQDKTSQLIEQEYNKVLFKERYLSVDNFTESVKKVSKEDVMQVARLIRLQSIYFMEGMEKE